MFSIHSICSLLTAATSPFTNLLSLIVPVQLHLFVKVGPSYMINEVSISVWRAGIANSGTPFILFQPKSSKIQLTGLTNQILFCFLYIYLLILISVFTVPASLLLNFVSLSMVTLASSCYARPPSPDKDALVGLLHTYVSLTLYSQATLFFASSLVQLLKSRIVSFFKDLSDVPYVSNLLV